MTFVPLFIVIDTLGSLPTVIALSEGVDPADQRKMVNTAALTAGIVGLIFLFFGRIILGLMNISVGAFAVAGGIILLILSVKYMLTGRAIEVIKEGVVAIVPIGTPLTVGPATITTLLLLSTQYPLFMVLFSFLLNIVIVWLAYVHYGRIVALLGHGGLRAISRVFNLLLAAIAVDMMIRGLSMIGILRLGT